MRVPTRQMWHHSLAVLGLVCLCLGAVCGRLAALQLRQHRQWQELAAGQQLNGSVISDKRGDITDRNGVVLAHSAEAATVIMLPAAIPGEEVRQTIVRELPELLGIDPEKLEKQTRKTASRYEVVCSRLDYETCSRFTDWVQQKKIRGIFRVIQDYRREYPLGSVL